MRPTLCLAALLAVHALAGDSALTPPRAPEREKAALVTASAVALDMARSLAFLEQGQTYYKAYAKGTHTPQENKDFVKFAEDYDRELTTMKKEMEVLKLWLEKKADLKPE